MANAQEKTRVTNFLKKLVEVDATNIREVADHYRQLNEVSKLAEKEMASLKKILLEAEVSEYFVENEEKVYFQEGSEMSALDTETVYESVPQDVFLKVATVSEKALKSNLDEAEAVAVIAKAKKVTGKKSPSVRVAKMTKNELKEMA